MEEGFTPVAVAPQINLRVGVHTILTKPEVVGLMDGLPTVLGIGTEKTDSHVQTNLVHGARLAALTSLDTVPVRMLHFRLAKTLEHTTTWSDDLLTPRFFNNLLWVTQGMANQSGPALPNCKLSCPWKSECPNEPKERID